MTLNTRLNEELNRLASTSGSSGAPSVLAVDVDGGRVECQVVAVDQLACSFEHLAYCSPALDQAKMDQLTRIAESLSKRLSYLLESISPVETDSEGCVVQMRSNPPHKDDDGMSYYELVVKRGEISLCRYSKASGQARRVIPAHVTREVFYRLARDLSTAVA
jgi:hypothetical protein